MSQTRQEAINTELNYLKFFLIYGTFAYLFQVVRYGYEVRGLI